MEEIESAEALKAGAPVVIYTYGSEDEPAQRYVGFLTGLDDVFLSAKVTHEWRTVAPTVIPESRVELREVLRQRKLWRLHLAVAKRYRVLTLGMSRKELVNRLADWMESQAVVELGTSTGFVEYPIAKHISMAIPDIRRLEALNDIRDSDVLLNLDFEPELPEEPEPKTD